jgi:error-prone DNA polymerase
VTSVQLALDLGDAPGDGESAGLPEMTASDRVRAELEILGLDASRHVMDFYAGFLDALGVTRAADLSRCRSRSEVLVAGVKVATQTPPIRSGRRVVFLTLDDGSGPADATFFEDVQGPYAATVFHSWLLVVRGVLRRTGRHGISLRATGAWELPALHELWRDGGRAGEPGGLDAVRAFMDQVPDGFTGTEEAVRGAAESRATRPVMAPIPLVSGSPLSDEETLGTGGHDTGHGSTAGGMGRRRVLVHSSGFRMSPYADIKPAGEDTKNLPRSQSRSEPPVRPTPAPRKLWHSSPGSSGG